MQRKRRIFAVPIALTGRQRRGFSAARLSFGVALMLLANAARAANDTDTLAPTFYVNASGGYSVYKSQMVQSNDTGTTASYGLGLYAGTGHEIGMAVENEKSTISFKLNSASIAVAWQDVHIRYRMGAMHFGIVLASSSWTVKAPPEDAAGKIDATQAAQNYIDIVANGYGFNSGVQIPIARSGSIYADVTDVPTSTVTQKAAPTGASAAELTASGRKTTLGPRLDMDLGGSIALTRSTLDFTAGFKYRTYTVTVDGKPYKESLNSTYMGLLAGWSF